MVNLVTGLVALAGLIVFLLHYAWIIESVPLWLIMLGTLLLPLYDWINALRHRGDG